MKILVTPTSLNEGSTLPAILHLREVADEIVFNPGTGPLHADQLIPLLQDVDGVVAGLDDYTADVLAAAGPRLKVISRYGTGTDRVDLAAAAARGIKVTTTPGANSIAVAELALGMMLALSRHLVVLDKAVRQGEWPRSHGIELTGKTLGIVGAGAIGRALAQRAQGLSMSVVGYDPAVPDDVLREAGITAMSLSEMYAVADIISLHVPLMDSTRHLIDADAIAAMKPGVLLVNTARGGLIDEDAALAALKSGQLGGLALDAYEVEPPGHSPLFELDNVVLAPHTGAHTDEAIERMVNAAVSNLLRELGAE